MLDLVLCRAVRVRCLDAAVRVFSDSRAIWIEDVLLPAGVLDGLDAVFLDALDGSVRED